MKIQHETPPSLVRCPIRPLFQARADGGLEALHGFLGDGRPGHLIRRHRYAAQQQKESQAPHGGERATEGGANGWCNWRICWEMRMLLDIVGCGFVWMLVKVLADPNAAGFLHAAGFLVGRLDLAMRQVPTNHFLAGHPSHSPDCTGYPVEVTTVDHSDIQDTLTIG